MRHCRGSQARCDIRPSAPSGLKGIADGGRLLHEGLSRFGRDLVAECNRLGIVVDCAHASFATTMAVLEASSQPVIISHGQLSNPGIAHPRLMTAQHAAAVAEAGGLVGAWPCGITGIYTAEAGLRGCAAR